MQTLLVQHPSDDREVRFDFWEWRVYRRLAADEARAVARHASPLVAARLERCACGVATETIGEEDERWFVERATRALGQGDRPSSSTATAVAVLVGLRHQRRLDAAVPRKWHLPVLRPAWGELGIDEVHFAGSVDGIAVRAQLSSDTSRPTTVDLGVDPTLTSIDVSGAIGERLNVAAALWDWLVARRLTIACLKGCRPWPAPESFVTRTHQATGAH